MEIFTDLNLWVVIVSSYFLGAIPSAVWFSKWLAGIDIREHGSGNAGFTNMIRVCGVKKSIPVVVIDLFKGIVVVLLAKHLFPQHPNIHILSGVIAIIGHIYPIFAGFRGGKGVLTALGVVFGLFPIFAVISLATFLLVFHISKIVSIGSLSAATALLAISVADYIQFGIYMDNIYYLIVACVIFAVVFITHRANILRLIRREELSFKKKKS